MKIIIKFINLCSKIFEVIEFIIEILENFLCSGKYCGPPRHGTSILTSTFENTDWPLN